MKRCGKKGPKLVQGEEHDTIGIVNFMNRKEQITLCRMPD
jgi:hypothetical protein